MNRKVRYSMLRLLLGSKKLVWSWKIVKEIQSTNSWWIGLRMSTLIAEQTLFGEVENHSVVRVFSLPSLTFSKDSCSIMDSGSAQFTWNLFCNKTAIRLAKSVSHLKSVSVTSDKTSRKIISSQDREIKNWIEIFHNWSTREKFLFLCMIENWICDFVTICITM